MHRGAHEDLDVGATGDLDRLAPGLERLLVAIAQVGVAAHLLEVEVGHVRAQVGEAPRHLGVVPDDHAGKAGEREPRDLERALRRHGAALEVDLGPDARDAEGEVRVVGEQGLSGRRAVAGDDPGVRADPVALADQGRDRRHGRGGRVEGALPPLEQRHRCRGGGLLVGGGRPGAPVLLGEDRLVAVERVGRVEQLDLFLRRATAPGEPGASELVLVVGLEVPGHRLEPRERVHRRPRLDPVARDAPVENLVLEGEVRG